MIACILITPRLLVRDRLMASTYHCILSQGRQAILYSGTVSPHQMKPQTSLAIACCMYVKCGCKARGPTTDAICKDTLSPNGPHCLPLKAGFVISLSCRRSLVVFFRFSPIRH